MNHLNICYSMMTQKRLFKELYFLNKIVLVTAN